MLLSDMGAYMVEKLKTGRKNNLGNISVTQSIGPDKVRRRANPGAFACLAASGSLKPWSKCPARRPSSVSALL